MADNKILDINEIIQNGVLIKKDLSNLDLSSLDLSNIEMSVWKGATFFNTCFKGTNIKFSPSDLKANCMCGYIDMSYCDFRDCDLSYLNEFDFYRVIIKGCNFFDTNLDINFETLAILNEGICDCFDLKDVTFSWQCLRQNPTNFDEYEIDVDTILKNRIPFVSSLKIQGAILDELNEKKLLINIMDIFDHVERYENLIKLDKQFFFRELYYYLKHEGKFDFKDSFEFFNGRVIKKHFDNLDLSFIPKDVLNGIRFNDCTFNSLTLPEDMLEKEFLKESENYQFIQANCSIGRVYIPNMTSSSWIKIKKSRIAQSPITFQTNLYLELERSCNANCPFCRNYCMDDKNYDLKRIISSLNEIKDGIHSIVIGGGEPTLYLRDLIKLTSAINKRMIISTNGTLSYQSYHKLSYHFDFNISRHAVDDNENAEIFGVKNKKILSTADLYHLGRSFYNKITLCATCFKGGLDTPRKIIEYIKFAQGILFPNTNILFQTLHQDQNSNNTLLTSENLFDDVINLLILDGYVESIPIYSTGNFCLRILKKYQTTISFKQYIPVKECEQLWQWAIKRSFDLSMDPSGNLYDNYNQLGNKIYIK